MSGHVPVLLAEALEGLRVKPDGVYLDGTFGRGGHARAVLARLSARGVLLAMDKDPEAILAARSLAAEDARVRVRHDSFAALAEWDETANGVDGVLFDLGVSSPQIDEPARGFSFMADGPLDMRMDPTRGISARDFLAKADVEEIADALYEYGEERLSRRIARAIVARRAEQPIETTRDLAELVAGTIGRPEPGRNPATRTFQALRILVNRELDDIADGVEAATQRMRPEGRLAVISFHSLEDRIVKRFIRDESKPRVGGRRGLPPPSDAPAPRLRAIGDAVMPASAEVVANPRARSAVLRVAERLS